MDFRQQNPKEGYTFTLPIPPSANRIWRAQSLSSRPLVYMSEEGRAYKNVVALRLRLAGAIQPILGPVAVSIRFFPHQPKDYKIRLRKHGPNWHFNVRALDLDNINKGLLDSLKGIAFEDDRFVHYLRSIRMPPDGEARVEVTITPLNPELQP